jgi:hypothetical protein
MLGWRILDLESASTSAFNEEFSDPFTKLLFSIIFNQMDFNKILLLFISIYKKGIFSQNLIQESFMTGEIKDHIVSKKLQPLAKVK